MNDSYYIYQILRDLQVEVGKRIVDQLPDQTPFDAMDKTYYKIQDVLRFNMLQMSSVITACLREV
jgi:hypothetical protein